MKSNSFLFGIVVINIVFIHFILVALGVIVANSYYSSLIDILVLALAVPGYFLINRLGKEQEKFTGQFLITTTIQMLAFLSIALAMVFLKITGYKLLVMTLLILFLVVLVAQTFFLIRALKKRD